MKRTSKIAALALTAGLAVVGIAAPAQAADTDATFTITGGSIAISAPTSTVNLGSVATGLLTAGGQLGPVTVADTRGLLVNGWITTVTSSAFTTGAGTAPHMVVTAPDVLYSSGASTSHTGLGTFVPGTKLIPIVYTGAAGNSSTTWDPTVSFTLLSSQVAGTYAGSVTHSLA